MYKHKITQLPYCAYGIPTIGGECLGAMSTAAGAGWTMAHAHPKFWLGGPQCIWSQQ